MFIRDLLTVDFNQENKYGEELGNTEIIRDGN